MCHGYQMDWISLLKAQQADFIVRVKKPKTYEVSLLESQAKGCHSEITTFWGENLGNMLEFAHQQAEVIARQPPPLPSEYSDNPDSSIPFHQYFQLQVEDYILREQIVDRVMSERLGKMTRKVAVDATCNMLLDEEGTLCGESKFPYFLSSEPSTKIQVLVIDGESFNGFKKDRVKWSVTQEDLTHYQVLIFLCLFYPFSTDRGFERQAIMAGFLPSNQLDFSEPKIYVNPSNLLYSGGLSWYLESLISNKEIIPADEIIIPDKIQLLPKNHPLKSATSDWECTQTLQGHNRGVNCLALLPRAKNSENLPLIASGSRGETKIWDFTQGELFSTFSEHPWITSGQADEINSLAFSPDGQTLVSGGADSTIKIWHVGAKDLIDILHKHNGMVRCVAFTPDGRMLVTGGDDRKILFWDFTQRQVVNTLSLEDTAAHALAFSPDGQILITGSYRKIKVWCLSRSPGMTTVSGHLIQEFTGHSHIVRSLVITSNGKLLVSASRDKTIKIWQIETGKLLRTLQGHRDGIYSIGLCPDDKIIASGSADKTIKLWDLETGELLSTFTGHANTVTSVGFPYFPQQKGNILISASLDKTIKIWQKKLS